MTMSITDTFDRTALLGVHEGTQAAITAALDAQARTGLVIVATGMPFDLCGQAALCTAVATAVRAFGRVIVVADSTVELQALSTLGACALARNTLGGIGLVTNAAMLVGAAGVAASLRLRVRRLRRRTCHTGVLVALWAWPIQPSTTSASWLTALGLFDLGAGSTCVRIARPTGHPLPPETLPATRNRSGAGGHSVL